MKAADVACVVLASGNSERFGTLDKLEAKLCGKPVLDHVLETVKSIGYGEIFLVSQGTSQRDVSVVLNHKPNHGQGLALRLGLSVASQAGWDCIAVVLGDMPLIKASHLEKMLKKLDQYQAALSLVDDVTMPPAVFQNSATSLILKDKSAAGARTIFRQLSAITVSMSKAESLDVDTPEDLARIESIMKASIT